MPNSTLPFVKYSGAGNDFIFIDGRNGCFASFRKQVPHLCHRHEGIGADGVLVWEEHLSTDGTMRIYNSDGTEAEMCGNGVRCFAHYIARALRKKQVTIRTLEGTLSAEVEGNQVTLHLPPPHSIIWNQTLPAPPLTYHILNTGVPHLVTFVPDVNQTPLEQWGPYLRHHERFAPHGVNVTIASLSANNSLQVRTYERGVEAITQACGTGAIAAALAAGHLYQIPSPITVYPPSQAPLTCSFQGSYPAYTAVALTGPAVPTFKGIINLAHPSKEAPSLQRSAAV